ncbi:hypothetical protein GF314_01400 [bacterium]|nr:hypothetical protein [bacterium]
MHLPSPTRRVIAWVSLIIVAVASAALWRLEVEHHGWVGLTWIGYEHRAIPVGIALFLGWLAFFCGVRPWWKRALFLVTLVVAAVLLEPLVEAALRSHFVYGPMEFLYAVEYGVGTYRALDRWCYALLAALPLLLLDIAHRFGVRPSWRRGLAGFGVYVASLPVAILALELTDHVGAADAIHALKSGFVIPMLVVGLGVPFVPSGTPCARPGDRATD